LLKMDVFSGLCIGIGVCILLYVVILMMVSSIIVSEGNDTFGEYYNNHTKKGMPVLIGIIGLIILIIGILIPTSKEMATIIVAPKIINNKSVQKLPQKVIDLAGAWLDELEPKSKKTSKIVNPKENDK